MSQSKISSELEKMIESFEKKESDFSASVNIKSSFSLFPAHFPDNPILPGFCQIRLIITAFNKIYGHDFRLSMIRRAKFYNIVKPSERIIIETAFSLQNKTADLKTNIRKNTPERTKISFFRLTAVSAEEF